jgi:hypothetical protein
MIREEKVMSIIRFYLDATDDPYAKYAASCTIMWESDTVIWVKALTGTLSRKVFKDFVQFILDSGITLVKSTRAGASLPFATHIEGNYCEIDVAKASKLVARFMRE